MTKIVTLPEIIDANLAELTELNANGRPCFESDFAYYYSEFLEHYISGAEIQSQYSDPLFDILVSARNSIRAVETSETSLEALLAFETSNAVLKGEIGFVVGLGYIKREDNQSAFAAFDMSWSQLKTTPAQRKALKALHNKVVAGRRLDPPQVGESEYELVYQQAVLCQDSVIMGTTLANLAWEAQKAGDFKRAIERLDEGLVELSKVGRSLNRYLTLLQRADVYCELGELKKARQDLDEARNAPYIEIREAAKVIEFALGDLAGPIDLSKLTPAWIARYQRYSAKHI